MNPRPFYLCFLLTFLSWVADAQVKYTLTGIVKSQNEVVSSGDAYLFSSNDSVLIKATFINNGNFKFEGLESGTYKLRISCSGFIKEVHTISLNSDLVKEFMLTGKSTMLQDVTIAATRRAIVVKNGNIKIGVENSLFATIPSAAELIGKLPSVQLGPGGESISIIGKGAPLIYIDERQVSFEEYSSVPVADIKSIEIINNPSAKYEANGRAVILVMRKNSLAQGLKMDVTETVGYRKYFSNRLGLSAAMKKSRLEVKGNIQVNTLNNWESNGYTFDMASPNVRTLYDLTSVTRRNQMIVGLGGFYQISEGDYISATATGRKINDQFPINTSSYFRDASNEVNIATENINSQQRYFLSTNINYNKKFKSAHANLFIGGQYTTFSRALRSEIFNSYNFAPRILSQIRDQTNEIRLYAFRADFEKLLQKDWRYEAGISFTFPDVAAQLAINEPTSQNYTSSSYDYRERGIGAYLQVGGKLLTKIDLAGGMRLEKFAVQGGFKDASSLLVSRDNVQLFPKLSGSYPFSGSTILNLNFARSISRPEYANLSQLSVYINPYYEWASNINIQPSLTNELNANVQIKDKSIQMGYYRVNGPAYSDFQFDEQASKLKRMDINFYREQGITLGGTVPFKYKVWTSTNTITAGIIKLTQPRAFLNKPSPYIYLHTQNQLKFKNDFSAAVTAWGITKRNEGVFQRNGQFAVDTSVSKTFNKKLVCTLSANNIFDSLVFEERFNINDIASAGTYYNTRDFSLSLKYSFGGLQGSKFKSREVDDGANRIK